MTDPILLPGLTSQWMNASGFFGYTPPAANILANKAGAFVTPAISKLPRKPAAIRCLVETPGGFLLHSGLPNDGFEKTLKLHAKKWAGLKTPVWPHLLPRNGYECSQMIRAMEELENIGAIEIELPASTEPGFVEEILQGSLGELPVYISVPFLSQWHAWLDLFRLYTIAGIVLSAPRGCIHHNGNFVQGRLYGPSSFPMLLETISHWENCGLPLIAGSGIFSFEDAEIALQAGASAIQFDAILWQLVPPTSPSRS